MYKEKKGKFIVFVLVAILLLLSGTAPAAAAPKTNPSEPTEGIKSKDAQTGSIDVVRSTGSGDVGAQAVYLISRYGCSISNLGGGKVSISGYTETSNACSSVSVTLYLQKWDGTKWVDIASQSFSGASANSARGTKTISVTRGANYRTRASHYAQNGAITDAVASTSSYINVN